MTVRFVSWLRSWFPRRPTPSPTDPRHALGAAGEHAAESHLSRHLGMTILARRYRARGGEIDLICRDQRTIVFVEVKARRNERFMDAIDAVTPEKQRRMVTAANAYLRAKKLEDQPSRFDIVTVVGEPPNGTIHHTPDAFLPGR